MRWISVAHGVTVAAHLGLLALVLSWLTWLAPPQSGLIAPLALITATPLVIGVRGILHARNYTLAWTSLVSLAYFIHGAALAGSPGLPGRLAIAEIVLSMALFAGCLAVIRLRRPR